LKNLQSIIVPGIIIGIIGGILLFFAAYNYYPQKNVNINLNGKCYEFLDEAYQKYKDLVSTRSSPFIPITFSGSSVDVDRIIDNFDINVTDIQTLGDQNTKVDKKIVKGIVSNAILGKILDNVSKNNTVTNMDFMPKFGILPNSGISASESARISNNIDQFMISGIKKIILERNDVKEAECRSSIIYND
jgi:hypothetical protein